MFSLLKTIILYPVWLEIFSQKIFQDICKNITLRSFKFWDLLLWNWKLGGILFKMLIHIILIKTFTLDRILEYLHSFERILSQWGTCFCQRTRQTPPVPRPSSHLAPLIWRQIHKIQRTTKITMSCHLNVDVDFYDFNTEIMNFSLLEFGYRINDGLHIWDG